MYRALVFFTDLRDGERPYYPGDTFPRNGLNATPERLEELASNKNRRGIPLIEFVPDAPEQTSEPDEPEEAPKARGRRNGKRNVAVDAQD